MSASPAAASTPMAIDCTTWPSHTLGPNAMPSGLGMVMPRATPSVATRTLARSNWNSSGRVSAMHAQQSCTTMPLWPACR